MNNKIEISLDLATKLASPDSYIRNHAVYVLRGILSNLKETSQINRLDVPEGWKLVPIKPTKEMREACVVAGKMRVWEDMMAATPDYFKEQTK